MQYMAPWVPAFTHAISRHSESTPFVTFSFATVDINGSPRVRTCIFRGFLFNDKKTNIITFTTDIRMEKFQDLSNNPKFEACFWFPETNEQFRFKGIAKLLTLDNIGDINKEIGEYPLISPNSLKQYSSSADLLQLSEQEGSPVQVLAPKPSIEEWDIELKSKWEALSRKLKSSFRKPQPGSELTQEKEKLLDSISRGVDGSNETEGMKNFALVVLLTDDVDYVDLKGHQSRYIYKRYDHDQWTEQEICP